MGSRSSEGAPANHSAAQARHRRRYPRPHCLTQAGCHEPIDANSMHRSRACAGGSGPRDVIDGHGLMAITGRPGWTPLLMAAECGDANDQPRWWSCWSSGGAMWTKGHGEVVAALLKAGCDTSLVVSIRDPQVRGLFVEHLEKKMRSVVPPPAEYAHRENQAGDPGQGAPLLQ